MFFKCGPRTSICSTRGWITWIKMLLNFQRWRRNFGTPNKRIASVTLNTETSGLMRHSSAFWIKATSTNTWVHARFSNTSFVCRAIRVNSAFRSTIWWLSNVVGQARTSCMAINFFAFWERTAGRRYTRIYWVYRFRYPDCWTRYKRISFRSRWTHANWTVIDYTTICCWCTWTRTRIHALLVYTRFVQSTFVGTDTFWTARWRASNVSWI